MEWNKQALEDFILNKVEENKHLEFKAANALSKSEQHKKEISKDVSSFANSDGGVLIYGIKEFDDIQKKYLPEKIDPIKRSEYSKEWLENIITGNISPIINNIVIYPVIIDELQNFVAYIVDIPKSNTAHQANDNRYYKRQNFKVIPMEDWEVKDVINRGNKASIQIHLNANRFSENLSKIEGYKNELQVILKNDGCIGIQQIECFVEMEIRAQKFIIEPRPLIFTQKIQVPLNNRRENKIKIGEEEAITSIYYQTLLPEVWREIGKIKVREGLFDLDLNINCIISTEFGVFKKEFILKEIIKNLN